MQPRIVRFAFIRNGVTRTTRTVGALTGLGVWAATLDHEVWFKPVKSNAVVIIALNERDEVCDGIWSIVLEKLDQNRGL